MAKGLRADGHLTTVVGDGRNGLDHALSGDFDLMVLDIGLPSLDGFDVLDRLRSQGSKLPVIVLTARDSVTDTVSALEGGANDYMAKPFRSRSCSPGSICGCVSAPTTATAEATSSRPAVSASTSAPGGPRWAPRRSSCRPASSGSPRS